MFYSKKLISLSIILCLLLPILFSCQTKQDDFSGGKDSLFNEDFMPKIALFDVLSGDKYNILNNFSKALTEATTPCKIDYDLKINKLQIKEGLSLNNTNKLTGTLVFDQNQSKATFDASILGNKIAGNLFIADNVLIAELPGTLDKFIKLPLDTDDDEDSAFPIKEMPTEQEYIDFAIALNELYEKVIEHIKNGIPDVNVETSKAQVEYGVGLTDAHIVSINLSKDEYKKIVLDILRYIKDDTRIEAVLTKLSTFEDPITTFTEQVEDWIKDIEEPKDESASEIEKVEIKATFVKSKLVGINAVIEESEGTSNFSFKYKDEFNVKRFIYNIKTKDGYIDATYAENTATNEYKLTVTDTINGYDFIVTLKIVDEKTFTLNITSFGNETTDITVNISISEVTDRSAKFKIGLIINDTVDVELNIKVELIGTYNFNSPTITADNTYDFDDAKQVNKMMVEIGKKFAWLYDMFGMEQPPEPDHDIKFDEVRKHNTNGALMNVSLKNILDGDGTLIATTRTDESIRYDIKYEKVLYIQDGGQIEFIINYYDGTKWFSLDEETEKLIPQDNVYLYLAEVLLLIDEAEFVVSGYATVDDIETIYEVFYYPTFESELCYLYDSNGNLLYLYNGMACFDVEMFGSSGGYIAKTVEQYS